MAGNPGVGEAGKTEVSFGRVWAAQVTASDRLQPHPGSQPGQTAGHRHVFPQELPPAGDTREESLGCLPSWVGNLKGRGIFNKVSGNNKGKCAVSLVVALVTRRPDRG